MQVLGLISCTVDQQARPDASVERGPGQRPVVAGKKSESSQQPEKVPVNKEPDEVDLAELWSYGLTSKRTGKALVEKGGEHKMDKSKVSYGYNLVVDRNGTILRPGGRPLGGGEKLIIAKTYQEDKDVREYARVFTFMAPIRDAILCRFKQTTKNNGWN